VSLRAFHLFFITVSALLAAFCAVWAFSQYRMDGALAYAAGSAACALSIPGLVVYGASFQRKTRNL